MTIPLLLQSGHLDNPYITVGKDSRGSVCWMVVAPDTEVHCTCGNRALDVYRALCRSRGIVTT